MKTQTIETQFDCFIRHLETRKRRPAKPATIASTRSLYTRWVGPAIGSLALCQVENPAVKLVVDGMALAGKAPASIRQAEHLVKAILKSAVDASGNALYKPQWNASFIDAPQVDPRSQKAPIITPGALQDALNSLNGDIRPLAILLAASGARIGEALAIKTTPDAKSSHWDRNRGCLVIQSQIQDNLELLPKTAAGIREIDLAPDVNRYLQDVVVSTKLFDQSRTTYRNAINKASIPGFHSLRRFRVTHLENAGVPRGLVMYWTGHHAADTHDLYVKSDKDEVLRREWAAKAGLGFTIPEAR